MKHALQSHVTERPLQQTTSTGVFAVLAGSFPVLLMLAIVAAAVLK